ncbi:MEDS domain-containing protein [Nocardia sp. NPDC055321]
MELVDRALEPHDHVVNVYDGEQDLIEDVGSFLADGLAGDAAVVIVATPPHRAALAQLLRERGIDLPAATAAGRVLCLDAADTLAQLIVNGVPNEAKFREVIGERIGALRAGGRPVLAFGEMVALLWAENRAAEAVALEALWNSLAGTHRFSLYCAYPSEILTGSGDLALIQPVCGQHSQVIAPRSYVSDGSGEEVPALTEDTAIYLPVPTAESAARGFVTERLRAWGRTDQVLDDAALVVSELAANAVAHAQSVFRVSLTRSDTELRIAVEDLSAEQPRLGVRDRTVVGGRGMLLVDALSHRWGVERTGSAGKIVWSEIADLPVVETGNVAPRCRISPGTIRSGS